MRRKVERVSQKGRHIIIEEKRHNHLDIAFAEAVVAAIRTRRVAIEDKRRKEKDPESMGRRRKRSKITDTDTAMVEAVVAAMRVLRVARTRTSKVER